MTNVGFLAQSPKPTSKRGRLGKFLHIQHSIQCLIILNMANLIQVKTAFMLHQDEDFGEFRGTATTITFRPGEVFINSLRTSSCSPL